MDIWWWILRVFNIYWNLLKSEHCSIPYVQRIFSHLNMSDQHSITIMCTWILRPCDMPREHWYALRKERKVYWNTHCEWVKSYVLIAKYFQMFFAQSRNSFPAGQYMHIPFSLKHFNSLFDVAFIFFINYIQSHFINLFF